jgi:hypothetical protein
MSERVALRHGRVRNLGSGRVGVHFLSNPALDNQPVQAELALLPAGEPERHVTVREGETFEVGPETWVLASVDNVGTYDYVVWIARQPS